ncbi:MAG: hypothetical protein IAE99_00215 [Rhodothermales bacterium]|nr:hypothetical protein [Rhodothermales bacterium]
MVQRADQIGDTYSVAQSNGSRQQTNKPSLLGWQELFGLDESEWEEHALYQEVLRLMSLVHSQADLLETEMSPQYSETLYQPAVNSIQAAVKPQHVHGAWQTPKSALLKHRRELEFAVEMLGAESSPPDEDQIEALLALLQSLRERIDELNLSPEFESFVLAQIGIVEKAIRDSSIIGVAAFSTAAEDLRGQFVARMLPGPNSLRDEAEKEGGREAFGIIGKAWVKLVEWGDKTNKVTKLLTAPQQALEVIGKILDSI